MFWTEGLVCTKAQGYEAVQLIGGLQADLFWWGGGAGSGSRGQRVQDLGCKAKGFYLGPLVAVEGFQLRRNRDLGLGSITLIVQLRILRPAQVRTPAQAESRGGWLLSASC